MTSLQKRGNASDVVNVTMRDQQGINLPNQTSPVTEQVNAWFPGIDEKMSTG